MALRDALPKIITGTMPGPKSQMLINRRKQAAASAVSCVYPVAIARGEGAMIEDLDGNRFLDWIGGMGVLNVGYSQPEIIDAVKAQSEKYFHGMFNIVTHEGYVALAEKLNQIAPVRGEKGVHFCQTVVRRQMRMRSRWRRPIREDRTLSCSQELSTEEHC